MCFFFVTHHLNKMCMLSVGFHSSQTSDILHNIPLFCCYRTENNEAWHHIFFFQIPIFYSTQKCKNKSWFDYDIAYTCICPADLIKVVSRYRAAINAFSMIQLNGVF